MVFGKDQYLKLTCSVLVPRCMHHFAVYNHSWPARLSSQVSQTVAKRTMPTDVNASLRPIKRLRNSASMANTVDGQTTIKRLIPMDLDTSTRPNKRLRSSNHPVDGDDCPTL